MGYDLLFSETDFGGNWMMLRGKRGSITEDDFLEMGDTHSLPEEFVREVIDQTQDAIGDWPKYAKAAALGQGYTAFIAGAMKQLHYSYF